MIEQILGSSLVKGVLPLPEMLVQIQVMILNNRSLVYPLLRLDGLFLLFFYLHL